MVFEGMNLSFFIVLVLNNGDYICVVIYLENGRIFYFSRILIVKVVGK